jgi:hypothetical protein
MNWTGLASIRPMLAILFFSSVGSALLYDVDNGRAEIPDLKTTISLSYPGPMHLKSPYV